LTACGGVQQVSGTTFEGGWRHWRARGEAASNLRQAAGAEAGEVTEAEAHDGRATARHAAPGAVAADDAVAGRWAVIGGYVVQSRNPHSSARMAPCGWRVQFRLAKGWNRPFVDPIPLPKGRQLVTLKDAARYIQKLPKAEQQIEEWQTAVEVLILVAESNGGPTRGSAL
jgi:hypothetical protein